MVFECFREVMSIAVMWLVMGCGEPMRVIAVDLSVRRISKGRRSD